MSNYRITAFGAINLDTTGVYAKSGDVGGKSARVRLVYPPFSDPINPYGLGDAPVRYDTINHTLLLSGTPDTVNTKLAAIRAQVGAQDTPSGRAGVNTASCTAFLTNVKGTWMPPFNAAGTQFLEVVLTFQPLTDWS